MFRVVMKVGRVWKQTAAEFKSPSDAFNAILDRYSRTLGISDARIVNAATGATTNHRWTPISYEDQLRSVAKIGIE